jgi:hypothetical protein
LKIKRFQKLGLVLLPLYLPITDFNGLFLFCNNSELKFLSFVIIKFHEICETPNLRAAWLCDKEQLTSSSSSSSSQPAAIAMKDDNLLVVL